MSAHITIDDNRLAELCKRHHIRKLSLFGSVLHDDFKPDSDVDVLVEFEPGQSKSFFRLFEIEEELSSLLGGRKVDLLTPRFLNRRIRDGVLKEAEVRYAED